jgi:AcrR family transcriptional regulator
MVNMRDQIVNGHQARTNATKAKLLAAAEEIFARDGFEAAQLETIARAANRTKGSVYSHFRSKDDLFLALYENRTRREIDRIFKVISTCQSHEESLSRFKKLLVDLSRDKTWFLLTLEFKLYSIRHPESRERWVQSYDMIRLAEREFLHEKLFGGLPKDRRQRLNTGVAAIAPVLSALTLETFFEPKHLATDKLRALLFRIFDVLLDPT